MKNTRTFIEIIALAVFIIISVISCDKRQSDKPPSEGDTKIVRLYNHDGIYAYNVDGHIYIFNSQGGAIHSESCPCKKP